ncbi:hypothetical protein PRZ48_011156 [Zasmidium cellare]|uniref:Uncharacterized protein n=1 Tax=Zasmidium cellare TaxID=395010 RepID=A0ABR0EAL3_ZASCE|nr:hypothetical protein PRZ48_011156 [Zasmidium cellare]
MVALPGVRRSKYNADDSYAILEAAKAFESTRSQLEGLKRERDNVALQLQQQKQQIQSLGKDKRLGLKREIKNVTETFEREEAVLKAKLAELRQKHEEVGNLRSQLDAFRQQSRDTTSPLCSREEEIDGTIREREQRLKELEQRLLSAQTTPSAPAAPVVKTKRSYNVNEDHLHVDFPTVILYEGAWCVVPTSVLVYEGREGT